MLPLHRVIFFLNLILTCFCLFRRIIVWKAEQTSGWTGKYLDFYFDTWNNYGLSFELFSVLSLFYLQLRQIERHKIRTDSIKKQWYGLLHTWLVIQGTNMGSFSKIIYYNSSCSFLVEYYSSLISCQLLMTHCLFMHLQRKW